MSKIKVYREHDLSVEERKSALTEMAAYLIGLGAEVSEGDGQISFSGRGFDGELQVGAKTLSGTLTLGLVARPFRRQLEQAIEAQISRRLARR